MRCHRSSQHRAPYPVPPHPGPGQLGLGLWHRTAILGGRAFVLITIQQWENQHCLDPSSAILGWRHRESEHCQQDEIPTGTPTNHIYRTADRKWHKRPSPDISTHRWQSLDWFTRQTTSTSKTIKPLLESPMSDISDEAFNGQMELNCSLEIISPRWLTTNNDETKLLN